MAFNFKRHLEVYLKFHNNTYLLDVSPEISFSQTFSENTTSAKTLHEEFYFEKSTITKANVANFSFQIPLLQEDDLKVVFERLLDVHTFDLFIKSDESTFKLETCVITEGSFVIERLSNLKLNISGQAAKLIREGSNTYNVPGNLQPRSNSRRFLIPYKTIITLGSGASQKNLSTELYNISASLQNDVTWTGYGSVHEGLVTSDRSNAAYPKGYTVNKKIFSGSLGYYLTDGSDSNFLNFSTDTPLRIQVGEDIGSTFYGLDFNMPNCSFTNRSTAAEVFTQHFDWRLTTNSNLAGILFYNTI